MIVIQHLRWFLYAPCPKQEGERQCSPVDGLHLLVRFTFCGEVVAFGKANEVLHLCVGWLTWGIEKGTLSATIERWKGNGLQHRLWAAGWWPQLPAVMFLREELSKWLGSNRSCRDLGLLNSKGLKIVTYSICFWNLWHLIYRSFFLQDF